jgi:signal transduction histidine kinase
MHSSTDRPPEPRLGALGVVAVVLACASVGLLLADPAAGMWDETVAVAVLGAASAVIARRLYTAMRTARQSVWLQADLAAHERERGELVDHVLETADDERSAIAHRLHDGPLQVLTAMRLIADVVRHSVEEGDTARALQMVQRLDEHAGAAADELRRMTGRLHPVVMEQQGLVQALGSLTEMVQAEYGVPADLEAPRAPWRSMPDRDTAIYQVAREAAVTAARSGAERVDIHLVEEPGQVRLTVTATGEDAAGGRHRQMSFRLMRERAARIGARITISDGPGGWRTEVSVGPGEHG